MTNNLLWLDDLRPAPEGWVWVKTVNDAINHLVQYKVDYASLDHDLGEYYSHGGDGTKLTDWMAENNTWPTQGIRIHSSNPVAVRTMLNTINRYGPYSPQYGNSRGKTPKTGWPQAVA